MIRVFFFLVLVALLATGAAWIADRPGEIVITWLGWRIETSVLVAAAALVLVVLVALLLWSVVRAILRSPDLIAMFLSHRRGVRGYLAISRGLIAIGAGDARAAKKAADEVAKIAPGEPLALLLNAQYAQLSGDPATAELAFRSMAERDDTKLLGLRGLYIEAQRRKDPAAARSYAEEAAKSAPSLGWAGQAVLDFRCASGDWAAALAALDRNSRNGLIDKADYRRQRAVLLTAQALAAEDGDRDRARTLALEAVKLAPALVPAAELAGDCSASRANCGAPAASSKRPGRPIRIPTCRTPMRICGRAIPRASGWRGCRRWRRRRPAMPRARWRWRAPRSTRRSSRSRARR